MEQKNITLTIDDKIHKLTDDLISCNECSLHDFCKYKQWYCCAGALGGKSFVELKVEK